MELFWFERNLILTSFAATGTLSYRGLGTGIIRALSNWEAIEFVDDRKACTFTVRIELEKIHHELGKGKIKVQIEPITVQNEPIKGLKAQIIELLRAKPDMSYKELAEALGTSRSTIMRHIQALKGRGILLRMGPKKTGYWKICLEKTT